MSFFLKKISFCLVGISVMLYTFGVDHYQHHLCHITSLSLTPLGKRMSDSELKGPQGVVYQTRNSLIWGYIHTFITKMLCATCAWNEI